MSIIDEHTITPKFTIIEALSYIIGLDELIQSGQVTVLQAAQIKHEILLWLRIITHIKFNSHNTNGISYYQQNITKAEIEGALKQNYYLVGQNVKQYGN